jgi:tRNA(Arg) A34 adenosine deaminase TadA
MIAKIKQSIEEAKKVSLNSDCNQKHGCVICDKNGNVLCVSYNHQCSNSFTAMHAEKKAIGALNRKLLLHQASFIVVIRYKYKSSKLQFSKPCSDCCKEIDKWGLTLYYSWVDEYDRPYLVKERPLYTRNRNH